MNLTCLVTDFTFNYDVVSWWKGSVQLPHSMCTTRQICGGIHSTLTLRNVAGSDGSNDYHCIAGTSSLPDQFESRHAVLSGKAWLSFTVPFQSITFC